MSHTPVAAADATAPLSAAATGPDEPTDVSPTTHTPAADARLDAERLDVYRVALEFQSLALTLVPRRGLAALRDQLDRASCSIVLNIAEGAGRFAPADKARFYGMARGSATECAAVVNLLAARRVAPLASTRRARGLIVRIVQMLTKLVARTSI